MVSERSRHKYQVPAPSLNGRPQTLSPVSKEVASGCDVVYLFNETTAIVEERAEERPQRDTESRSGQAGDLQKFFDDLTPYARDLGLPTSRAVLDAQFVQRVRDHLHTVLCMSSIVDAFRAHCTPSATCFLKDVQLFSEGSRVRAARRAADWENSKELLAKVDFLKMLKEYDKDNIDPARSSVCRSTSNIPS